MAYMLKLSVLTDGMPQFDPGENFSDLDEEERFFYFGPLGVAGLDGPELVNESEVPDRWTSISEIKTFPHFVTIVDAVWVVSENVKKIVESIEPNRHQFVGVDLNYQGGRKAERQYYYLNVMQYIDSVIVSKSDVAWNVSDSEIPPTLYLNDLPEVSRLVISRPQTSGRHLWRGRELFHREVFISNEMYSALRESNLLECVGVYEVQETEESWSKAENLQPILDYNKKRSS